MPVASSSTAPSTLIQVQPNIGRKFGCFMRDIYNYDETAKTTRVSLETLKNKGTEVEKLKFMVKNIKAVASEMAMFVKEIHERRFNDQKPMNNATMSLYFTTGLFVSLMYISQLKKAIAVSCPIFGNLYSLGKSVYERNFWKGLESFEKVCDNLLNAKSTSVLAITDGSEKKAEVVEVQTEEVKKVISQESVTIELVLVDDLPEDRPD